MKNISISLITCFLLFSNIKLDAQEKGEKAIVLISSYVIQGQLDQMVKQLDGFGITLRIDEVEWKAKNQLRSFKFGIKTSSESKSFIDFDFQYNMLNESVILAIYPRANGKYGVISAHFSEGTKSDLWGVIENVESNPSPKTVVSTLAETFTTQDGEALSFLFDQYRTMFDENLGLLEKVKYDRDFGKKDHFYRYYYNGERMADSYGIHTIDMKADVEMMEDPEGVEAIYFTSPTPVSAFAAKAQ